jgi:hypothetical protein
MPGQDVLRTLLTEGLEHENRRMLGDTFYLDPDADVKKGTHEELKSTEWGVEGPSLGDGNNPNKKGATLRDPWGSRAWTPSTNSAYL